jgi:DnaK suppressor protein
MSDEADRANDTAQFINDLALRQHRLAAPTTATLHQVAGGAMECLDCGVEIPPGRLAALSDCIRCVDCQTAHEKELRLWL